MNRARRISASVSRALGSPGVVIACALLAASAAMLKRAAENWSYVVWSVDTQGSASPAPHGLEAIATLDQEVAAEGERWIVLVGESGLERGCRELRGSQRATILIVAPRLGPGRTVECRAETAVVVMDGPQWRVEHLAVDAVAERGFLLLDGEGRVTYGSYRWQDLHRIPGVIELLGRPSLQDGPATAVSR